MATRYGAAKHAAQGASRGKIRPPVHHEAYAPEPAALALLRGVWGKRDLLEPHERAKVWGFLQWIRQKALTPGQLDAAKRIGASVGIGFDDPAIDEPVNAGSRTAPAPWGPLPLRPPGR